MWIYVQSCASQSIPVSGFRIIMAKRHSTNDHEHHVVTRPEPTVVVWFEVRDSMV
jgi:hypothetical protein